MVAVKEFVSLQAHCVCLTALASSTVCHTCLVFSWKLNDKDTNMLALEEGFGLDQYLVHHLLHALLLLENATSQLQEDLRKKPIHSATPQHQYT